MRMLFNIFLTITILLLAACGDTSNSANNNEDNLPEISGYPVVSTNQTAFYDNNNIISAPISGNAFYGQDAQYSSNEPNYLDNGDGTVTDKVTGLMWMQNDSRSGMNWEDALAYAENLEYAGYSDWRLPDVKKLQSIVDYTRSPGTTSSAAIDSLFNCTPITNEANQADYASYWSSTTHVNWSDIDGANAAYVSFGRAMGHMFSWEDVHGAGAQRSDPKIGDPNDYPIGHGPQGDAIRIFNYVRCVRTIQ